MEQPKNNLKLVTDKKNNARVILPNMLTLIGVCIGLSSIRFALDGKFEFAVIAIILAAIIDGLDGRIARLIKGTSKVGKELDSLTDMISFGVAPAFIMYFWKLNTSNPLKLNIKGVSTNIPPAGDGTPSKKLSFQEGSSEELTLNLANLNATQIT